MIVDLLEEVNKTEVVCPVCGEEGKLCIYRNDKWYVYHPANEYKGGTTCWIPVKFRAQLIIEKLQRDRGMVETEMIEPAETACVLCGRPGYPASYFPPPDHYEEVEIFLCQFHKGNYMTHGIEALDELWLRGGIQA